MRIVRFGAWDGVRYSQYWKVAAMANRPELVLAGNRTGRFLHLTMHEDEAFWHLKVTLPTEVIERPWRPPADVLPGLRRLVRLIIPFQAVRYPEPSGTERVIWYPGAASEQTWTEFTILHARHGRPEVQSADLLGSVDLADRTEALVIGRPAQASSGSFTFAGDPDAVRQLRDKPGLGALIHGVDPDGCIWFLHLVSSPRAEEST